MDKFVTRAPSWKTLNYGTMATSCASLGTQKKVEIKKPLLNQQQSSVDEVVDKAGRLSIRDDRLSQLFKPRPGQPLSSDSSCNGNQSSSCSSSLDYCRDENVQPNNNSAGKLSDYVSCSEDKNSTLTVSLTPPPNNPSFDVLVYKNLDDNYHSTPVSQQPQLLLQSSNLPASPRHVIMARIQRDLNSPSAALRLRAMKALKSPSNSCYSHFDVAHDEQSLIMPGDRKTPPPAPTIQELMRDIIVYVEVRTGEDNRSAGVKKVISALGAKVNDKLLRDTTHVVFKDGLLSTYKKATNWYIPVVSILWIEACKNQRRICDPKEFPISNIDRYENPELYDKMKRHKSMQPDSECNKRVRIKPLTGTPKDSTPKTAANVLKKTSMLSGITPTSASNKKTDISHYFNKAQSNKKHENQVTPASSVEETRGYPDSPATQLLNRINSNCFTPIVASAATKQKLSTCNHAVTECNNVAGSTSKLVDAKKMLNFVQQKPTNLRRRSASIQARIEATTNSIEDMSLSQTPIKGHCASSIITFSTPGRLTRRRYSMNMSVQAPVAEEDAKKQTPLNKCPAISEEEHSTVTLSAVSANAVEIKPESQIPSKRATGRRRTTFSNHQLDISECSDEQLLKEKQPQCRRTHYTPHKMDETLDQNSGVQLHVSPTKIIEPPSEQQPKDKPMPRRCILHKVKETPTKAYQSPKQITECAVKKQVKNRRRTMYATEEVEKLSLKNLVVITLPTTPYSSEAEGEKQNIQQTPESTEITLAPHVAALAQSNTADFQSILPASESKANQSCSDTELETTLTLSSDTAVTSSTELELEAVAKTPQHPKDTLLEERVSTLTFSSTREPGRRRTFFDLSMDIITHRLQNINRSARRSIIGPSVSDLEVRRSSLDQETAVLDTSHSAIGCKKSTNSGDGSITSDKCNKEQHDIDVTPNIKKKRKLFVPNSSSLILTPTLAPISSNTSLATPIATAKRRKTLVSLSQSKSETKTRLLPASISAAATTKKMTRTRRRSTFDFVEPVQSKTSAKSVSVSTTSIASSQEQQTAETAAEQKASKCSSTTPSKKDNSAERNTNSIALLPPKAKKQLPFLVYTNMHKEQIEVIQEALNELGGFELENCVSDHTTHLVSLEPRRTLNVLRALVRGLWILEYTWITDSLQSGFWLSEELYEMRDFSRAVEICRAERQAFGSQYKCELFSNLGAFYISAKCGHISKTDLTELIKLCGGNVVDQRKRAKYILGNSNLMDNKVYMTPYWILDSITQMQLMHFHRYTLSQETQHKLTLTQPQPWQTPIQIQSAQ